VDHGGYFGPTGLDRRPQSALAGHELPAVAEPPHDQGLQQAMCFDAVGKFRDGGFVEVAAGLKRIAFDRVHVEVY
jgi:hypothetical protein